MSKPLLIDTDMGVDDAVALCLALPAPELDTRAIVSVGGNVDLEQATSNIGRLLRVLQPKAAPRVGRGLDQPGPLSDARWLFGEDGLGEADLAPPDKSFAPEDFRRLYAEMIDAHPGELIVLAIGPLTNLAAILDDDPQRFARIGRLVIMGGAVWTPGNVEGVAEFNFYRDAEAAAAVLHSGLDITLAPLDVTRHVRLDESHRALFAAADTPCGPLLADILAFPMAHGREPPPGTFLIHDALAVGAILWPDLFMRTRVALDVNVTATLPGASKPARRQDPHKLCSVLLSVNQDVYLGKLIDVLSNGRFHV